MGAVAEAGRERFAGAVLTGGLSARMGRDKALLRVDGVPMAVRVATALRAGGADPVAAIGGDGPGLRRLGLAWWPDQHAGEGPLGGVATALDVLGDAALVAVLATDLPDVTAETVVALVDAVGGHDVAVATTGRLQPLCAVWRVARCSAVVASAFASGERAVHRVLTGLEVVEVPVAGGPLRNINTPDDLDR